MQSIILSYNTYFAIVPMHIFIEHRQVSLMTYDRLKAKIIPGEHCRFCGNDSVPLVKTKCCNQWICCDTSYISIEPPCPSGHNQA